MSKSQNPVPRIKQWRRRITYSDPFLDFVASLSVFIIKCYVQLLRIQMVRHPEFLKIDRHKTLVAFWHGRILLPIYACGSWHMVIMTDKSWAGEILARILRKFGHRVVRGSSKHGGFRGVLDMKAVMEKGNGGALAVDGPRGPIHKTKPGILYLSHKLNYPIVLLTFASDKAWIFKSTWDHFMLPKPFAKCRLRFSAPVWDTTVKGKMTPEALDDLLMKFTLETDRQLQS